MKISKRQLKRIIKEEKAKLLREQGAPDLSPEQEARAVEIIQASFEMLENDLYQNGIELTYMGQLHGLIEKALESY